MSRPAKVLLRAGTLLTAQLALEHGLACSTAGGTHHAQSAAGSGFCIINDLAITALLLRTALPQRAQRILILDLDVHQGDGTAEILSPRRGGVAPQPSPFSAPLSISEHSEKCSNSRSIVKDGLDRKIYETGASITEAAKGGLKGWSLEGISGGGDGELRDGGGGIFTCSVHAERNFPARKQQSTLDVGLPDGIGDQEYLRCAVYSHS